jgi:hypothetical protein
MSGHSLFVHTWIDLELLKIQCVCMYEGLSEGDSGPLDLAL